VVERKEQSHGLRVVLLLFLLAAVLFILIAPATGSQEVGAVLLGLPVLVLVFGVVSLTYRLVTRRTQADQKREPMPQEQQEWWRRLPKWISWMPGWVVWAVGWVVTKIVLLVPLAVFAIAFLGPAALFALFVFPFEFSWFRTAAIIVSGCIWAILAWLYLTPGTSHRADAWLREQTWQRRRVRISLLVMALLSLLIAWKRGAWAYSILLTAHNVASAPETVHALLGVVAGLMCGNFSRWMDYAGTLRIGKDAAASKSPPGGPAPTAAGQADESEGAPDPKLPPAGGGSGSKPPPAGGGNDSKPSPADGGSGSEIWPVIVFTAAFSCIIVAALLAPYAQGTLSRVSGLETPYLKVQFAISPAEKQQILNVERDLNIRERLEEFWQEFRFIQYDCAAAALDAKMRNPAERMDHFVSDWSKSQDFRAGYAFHKGLSRYVSRLVSAQRQGYNLFVLKSYARRVAEKLALVVSDQPAAFHDSYKDVITEVKRQYEFFKYEGVGFDALPEEDDDRDLPSYCASEVKDIADITEEDIKRVVQKKPRYIYGVAGALFVFAGDNDAANEVVNSAFLLNKNTDDINLIAGHGSALYEAGQDLREVLSIATRELEKIDEKIRQLETVIVSDDDIKTDSTRRNERKIRDDLVKRYRRGRFIVRLRLAYLWAQHGLGSEEDLLPQRELRWSTALKYADDAYASLLDKSESQLRFPCIDHAWDLTIKDTHAFVKLAYQAYNLRTQRIPPDESQVRAARSVLEDAWAEAREELRLAQRVQETRDVRLPSCFTEVESVAWVKRITSHLKLADALRL
jgi:hypothetical protein